MRCPTAATQKTFIYVLIQIAMIDDVVSCYIRYFNVYLTSILPFERQNLLYCFIFVVLKVMPLQALRRVILEMRALPISVSPAYTGLNHSIFGIFRRRAARRTRRPPQILPTTPKRHHSGIDERAKVRASGVFRAGVQRNRVVQPREIQHALPVCLHAGNLPFPALMYFVQIHFSSPFTGFPVCRRR